MTNNPISRRNFMQQSALWAAAFAGAGTVAHDSRTGGA